MSTSIATLRERRHTVVRGLLEKVRKIEQARGHTRESLEAIKQALVEATQDPAIFVTPEFEPAQRGTFKDFVAYRLNEDHPDGRALYLSLALPGKESPPHNHNNWAVLAGIKGAEENRLYKSEPDGSFSQIDSILVGPGTGVALMPDDIHSIHVQGRGDEPVWQLRFYERPLEEQTDRAQYDPATGKTTNFPPNVNVKKAP
ncbi:MAG TPA: hypothetical protein VEA17_01085 [Bordetella sp.]|nr:hypothetical protein [Bordetella sp.]